VTSTACLFLLLPLSLFLWREAHLMPSVRQQQRTAGQQQSARSRGGADGAAHRFREWVAERERQQLAEGEEGSGDGAATRGDPRHEEEEEEEETTTGTALDSGGDVPGPNEAFSKGVEKNEIVAETSGDKRGVSDPLSGPASTELDDGKEGPSTSAVAAAAGAADAAVDDAASERIGGAGGPSTSGATAAAAGGTADALLLRTAPSEGGRSNFLDDGRGSSSSSSLTTTAAARDGARDAIKARAAEGDVRKAGTGGDRLGGGHSTRGEEEAAKGEGPLGNSNDGSDIAELLGSKVAQREEEEHNQLRSKLERFIDAADESKLQRLNKFIDAADDEDEEEDSEEEDEEEEEEEESERVVSAALPWRQKEDEEEGALDDDQEAEEMALLEAAAAP
jgi:hypothetical protein